MEVQCYRALVQRDQETMEDFATEVVRQNVVHVPTAVQGIDVGSVPERGSREPSVTTVKIRASEFTRRNIALALAPGKS